jgi:hypothetical protein
MSANNAVGFNWLIAGTDAHAKNYSLLEQWAARPPCPAVRSGQYSAL